MSGSSALDRALPSTGEENDRAGDLGSWALHELRQQASAIRRHILAMAAGPEGAHLGGSMSVTDILTVLYFRALWVRPEDPGWPDRDHFILSKGHASAALYATLAARGYFPVEELSTYGRPGSRLAGHPIRGIPGVEFPTGSLGHGLALAGGIALAARMDGRPSRAFVLLGDGELQEGSVWEAAMSAAHFGLDNLVAIVDRNGLQITGPTEQCMRLEPLADRWRSFGWAVAEVDGHDVASLVRTLTSVPLKVGSPTVCIAHTIKGRGVKFMEGRKKSHYATLTPELLRKALHAISSGEAAG